MTDAQIKVTKFTAASILVFILSPIIVVLWIIFVMCGLLFFVIPLLMAFMPGYYLDKLPLKFLMPLLIPHLVLSFVLMPAISIIDKYQTGGRGIAMAILSGVISFVLTFIYIPSFLFPSLMFVDGVAAGVWYRKSLKFLRAFK